MIRLLMSAPFIAIICLLYLGYLLFGKVQKDSDLNIKNLSVWGSLIKGQQELNDHFLKQKADIEEEQNITQHLDNELGKSVYVDSDLSNLREQIRSFNDQFQTLAKNEIDMTQLNDFLSLGINSLKAKIVSANTTAQRKQLNEQMTSLVDLQNKFIDKSEDYNTQSHKASLAMKETLKNASMRIADLKVAQQSDLKEKLDLAMDRQKDMLVRIEDQRQHLLEIRQQLNITLQNNKQRTGDLVSQNQNMMEEAKQRTKDQQEMMKDRVKDQMQRIRDHQRDLRK